MNNNRYLSVTFLLVCKHEYDNTKNFYMRVVKCSTYVDNVLFYKQHDYYN